MRSIRYTLFIVGILFCQPTFALADFLKPKKTTPSNLLAAKDAFVCQATLDNQQVTISWQIAQGYYLYADKFNVSRVSANHGLQILSFDFNDEPSQFEDPYFGQQKIFTKQVDIAVKLPEETLINIIAEYQGCAMQGYCYPPSQCTFAIDTKKGLISPNM